MLLTLTSQNGPTELSRNGKPEADAASFRLPSVVNRRFWLWSFGGVAVVVASVLRVREVADPKCRYAGAGRPRWMSETPRSALPDPCQRFEHRQRVVGRGRRRSVD